MLIFVGHGVDSPSTALYNDGCLIKNYAGSGGRTSHHDGGFGNLRAYLRNLSRTEFFNIHFVWAVRLCEDSDGPECTDNTLDIFL